MLRARSLISVAVLLAASTIAAAAPSAALPAPSTGHLHPSAVLSGNPADLTRRQGNGVAMSGDGRTVAVAAASAEDGGVVHGLIYVYLHGSDGWHIQAVLHPRDAGVNRTGLPDGGYYGTSTVLSTDGNLIAVGYYDIAGYGSVDSFARTGATWTAQPTLVSPRPRKGFLFGAALSMSGAGDTLLVSQPGPLTWNGSQRGAVWTFTRTTSGWGEPRELSAPNPDTAANFGGALALSRDGRTAAVQSNYTNDGTYSHGHVYVYTSHYLSEWRVAQVLVPAERFNSSFGNGLAISADGATIVVGDSNNPASTFVYDRGSTGWFRSASFNAKNILDGGQFGRHVAVSDDGNDVIVTAPYRSAGGGTRDYTGGGYRFHRDSTGWHWGGPVWSVTSKTGELMGFSLSMSADGDAAVLGAPFWYDWASSPQPGSAYIFTT